MTGTAEQGKIKVDFVKAAAMFSSNKNYRALQDLLVVEREDNPVVFFNRQESFHFSQLRASVSRLAALLSRKRQSRWALYCEDAYAFAVGFLALLHSDKSVILPQNVQGGTLSELAVNFEAILSDLKFSVAGAECLNPLNSFAERDFSLKPLVLASNCIEIFTSGTTAAPVRVCKTIGHLSYELEELERCFGNLMQSGVVYSTVSQQHIYGLLFRVLWPLVAGRPACSSNITYPEELLVLLQVNRNNIVVSSPAHLKRLPQLVDLAELGRRCSSIFSSGGLLPEAVGAEFLKANLKAPIEVLGSTETGGIAWRQPDDSDESKLWQPFRPIKIRRSDNGSLLEVCSKYAGNAPGQEWLQTGDMIEFNQGGCFKLLGRADRIVKIEGKKVSLPEVEKRLSQHELVSEARLLLLTNTTTLKRERIGAVIVPSGKGKDVLVKEGAAPFSDLLKHYLLNYFEPVTLPRFFRFVQRFPENSQGKVSTDQLERLFSNIAQMERFRVASCSILPEIVAREKKGSAFLVEAIVPHELWCFKDHFPDNPIVPGYLQLVWLSELLNDFCPSKQRLRKFQRLKFHSPLRPGQHFVLEAKWEQEEEILSFAIRSADSAISSGRVVLQL